MVSVDLYSDVVCPWCFIGSDRLEQVLAGTDVPVRYRPFLLDPATPPEGKDIPAMLRQKYGVDPRAAFARVEAAARESGLALDLSRQSRSYPTVRAHTLLRHAAERGTQRKLARALFEANFVDAKDISDPAVLIPIAAAHGFAADEAERLVADQVELAETLAEAVAASRSGIRGVPFFVFDGRLAVSGAQPIEVLRGALAEAQAAAKHAAPQA